MYSRLFVLIDPPLESSSVNDSSIEAKIDSSSSVLRSFDSYYYILCSFYTKPSSSNCAKVMMQPVCSWDDTAYEIYETAGRTAIASEYGHDVYAHALENIL